jgi:hypothetical protein
MPATYEPIATATGDGSSGTITFSSISGYTDIRAILNGTTTTSVVLGMRFNGDTASNYSQTYLAGNGTTASSYRESSQDRNYLHSQLGTSTTIPQMWIIDIFNYSGSTNKTSLVQCSMDRNGTGVVEREVCLYRSTSAITSISFLTGSGAFSTNFTATLYGIKAA